MQEQSVTGSGAYPVRLTFSAVTVLMLVVLAAWALVFHKGLISAVAIWYGSDIFNHCMFVLPGAFYLIYLKRDALLNTPIKPSMWTLIFIAPLVALYAVGLAGDVQIFMHAAMFRFSPSDGLTGGCVTLTPNRKTLAVDHAWGLTLTRN